MRRRFLREPKNSPDNPDYFYDMRISAGDRLDKHIREIANTWWGTEIATLQRELKDLRGLLACHKIKDRRSGQTTRRDPERRTP